MEPPREQLIHLFGTAEKEKAKTEQVWDSQAVRREGVGGGGAVGLLVPHAAVRVLQ